MAQKSALLSAVNVNFSTELAAGASTNISTTGGFEPPRFGEPGEVRAVAARRAARLNASKFKPSEKRSLLAERAELISKKYIDGLNNVEERRLRYVDWSLDRIEDAEHGQDLDELENLVHHIEKLESDLAEFYKKLESAIVR